MSETELGRRALQTMVPSTTALGVHPLILMEDSLQQGQGGSSIDGMSCGSAGFKLTCLWPPGSARYERHCI